MYRFVCIVCGVCCVVRQFDNVTHILRVPPRSTLSFSDGTDSAAPRLPMAIATKASIALTNATAAVSTVGATVAPTMESFVKTSATELASSVGRMAPCTRANSAMVNVKVTARICLVTAVGTREVGEMAAIQALERVHGKMVVATRVNG